MELEKPATVEFVKIKYFQFLADFSAVIMKKLRFSAKNMILKTGESGIFEKPGAQTRKNFQLNFQNFSENFQLNFC